MQQPGVREGGARVRAAGQLAVQDAEVATQRAVVVAAAALRRRPRQRDGIQALICSIHLLLKLRLVIIERLVVQNSGWIMKPNREWHTEAYKMA